MKYKLIIAFIMCYLHLINQTVLSANQLKIGESFKFLAIFHDVKTGSTMSDTIVLTRKFGFCNRGQKKIEWKYSPISIKDSLIYKKINSIVGNNNCTGSHCESNWDTLNNLHLEEITGLIENRKEYWIHPPRSKYFRILEFSPFPYYNKKDDSYKSSITLGTNWGEFEGITVNSTYQVIKNVTDFVTVCAYSYSKLGEVKALFKFDKKGIYSIQYHFFNDIDISIMRV